ncbi:hypothetical protein [Paraburkholderia sp. RL17-337-BIB-A]|uniref:hypothetical protein n=1 Tax=Paraburkholderia sp. RL17-337-BIB-A TaxID=3031636 RepID=UPI0038B75B77
MERMRGPDGFTESMFTVLELHDFVPKAANVAPRGIIVGADKNYDTAGFVASCRADRVTPHVAQNVVCAHLPVERHESMDNTDMVKWRAARMPAKVLSPA